MTVPPLAQWKTLTLVSGNFAGMPHDNSIGLTSKHMMGKLEITHKVRRMTSGFAAAGFRVAATVALDFSEIRL